MYLSKREQIGECTMSSEEILQEIATEVSVCEKCRLCQGRNKAVPGEGNLQTRILFIGEGPGYHEDQQGRPFVGPAGRLLEEALASIQLKRSDVFITNVVKCRPPENRDPNPDEIQACNGYLERQIEAKAKDLAFQARLPARPISVVPPPAPLKLNDFQVRKNKNVKRQEEFLNLLYATQHRLRRHIN